MPLHKRSTFDLAEPPVDLDPNEEVYTIRFTREIFRDYNKYLERMHMYRKKIWACRVTGKANLTYEEALVSESKASQQAQSFPKEFIGPVLRAVQFSPLCVSEIVDNIHKRYKDHFVEGESFDGVTEGVVAPCRILRVVDESEECEPEVCSCSYDVVWLKTDGTTKSESTETVRTLKRKKYPLTKNRLKTFIRESATIGTSKKSRWVVHEHLALEYDLPRQPEDEEEDSAGGSNKENKTNGESSSKRKEYEGDADNRRNAKKKKIAEIEDVPIDDELLPEPTENDSPRPVPHSDFILPSKAVGSTLMIWSFCRSFFDALELTPFSLEDLQRAVLHQDDECTLIIEVHHALLKAIIQTPHLEEKLLQHRKKDKKGKRKQQVLLPETWLVDAADVLEVCNSSLKSHSTSLRLGNYAELETLTKVDVLRELVDMSLNSPVIKGLIDMHVPKRSDNKKKQAANQAEADPMDEDDADEPPPIVEHVDGTNGMVKAFKKKKKSVSAIDRKKEKEEADSKKCPLRNILLGSDRSQNRYWLFPKEGQLFIESDDSLTWSHYNTRQEFNAFIKSLNTKGTREKALKQQLELQYELISDGLQEEQEEESDDEPIQYRRGRQVPNFLRYINKVRIENED